MKITDSLTFDDVLLRPKYSTVQLDQVSLDTNLTSDIGLHMPIVSSAMDTVTESRLAIAMAQEGGLGVIHKNMSIDAQVHEVEQVKKFESGVVRSPITVSPETTVAELLNTIEKNKISGLPVVHNNQLIGIVTNRDIRFESDLSKQISSIMTPKEQLVTVREGAPETEIIKLLHEHRIEKLPVVDENFELRGLITVKDMQKEKDKPLASKDAMKRLRVGAAIGTQLESQERALALIDAGVDLIVIDTAHGHSGRVIEQVKWLKKQTDIAVIAGNIASSEGAKALVDVGADAVKVGIGPGSICTTRVVTGVGVPQLTAIMEVANALKGTHIPVIADGGIRFSGDVCKALAAGASVVMIGSLFAGTEEAPGEIELYQGRSYKHYRGMGSLGAMQQSHGSSDRYAQAHVNQSEKYVPEGIEGRTPYKGPLQQVIYQLTGGLRACMGYLGADNLSALRDKAEFIRLTHSGLKESHVHDVSMTKQAPNYQVGDDLML